jgi:hypothetical protein
MDFLLKIGTHIECLRKGKRNSTTSRHSGDIFSSFCDSNAKENGVRNPILVVPKFAMLILLAAFGNKQMGFPPSRE